MSNPLLVEIIAYAPTAFYHCMHCEVAWREMGMSNRAHEEQLQSSLPEDLAQDYLAVSTWVKDVFRRFCDQVVIKVVDAASLEGFYKSLRYSARRYPAVIINGQVFTGGQALESAGKRLMDMLEVSQPA
jgi:hypothetical protein